MLIAKLGEFALIQRLRSRIKLNSSVIIGSGDDCAVLKFDQKRYQLFTCDMLIEGVDFSHQENPYLIGRKALGVCASDIAACAGLPEHCLVSLGLAKNTPLKFVDRLFQGMLYIAHKYKINIAGGDLSRAKELTIDVSMLGLVEKKYLVLRNGARVGDIIFVTGALGGSWSGKHLRFNPRIKEARLLVKNFKVNAMIDISDGLTQDLSQILKASKVGAIIYEDLIPLSRKARDLNDALTSGEDFELLFTVLRKEAKKILKKRLTNFQPIGEITDKRHGLRLIDKKNRQKIIQPKGYQHF